VDYFFGHSHDLYRIAVVNRRAVEKGTKAVISVNFSVCGGRTFNTYERISPVKFPKKGFSTATGVCSNNPNEVLNW
jgi:hypothetical protein